MKVEKQLKERRGSSFRSFNREEVSNRGNGSTSKVVAPPKTAVVKQPPKNELHIRSTGPNTSSKCRKCFKCQGLGHFCSDCQNSKIVSLVE